MKLTALGRMVVVHPAFDITGIIQGVWFVVQVDKNGNWSSGSVHGSKEAAIKERSRLFQLHRKLAKERASRKCNPAMGNGE